MTPEMIAAHNLQMIINWIIIGTIAPIAVFMFICTVIPIIEQLFPCIKSKSFWKKWFH